MSWSDGFKGYIEQRFGGDRAQQRAAEALGVSPSAVSYWCRGSVPREKTRRRIEAWSEGAVVAAIADRPSGTLADSDVSSADGTGTDSS